MKLKVKKILRFFEFFGLYFETEASSKSDRFFVKFARYVWFSLLVLMVLTVAVFFYFTSHLWQWNAVLPFLFVATLRLSEFLVLFLTKKKSEKEQKLLKNLTEVDELMKDFLHIKIDHVRFCRAEFLRIFVQLTIFLSGLFVNEQQKTQSNLFRDYSLLSQWSVTIVRIFMLKYNFYVGIMHCQMKVSLSNATALHRSFSN